MQFLKTLFWVTLIVGLVIFAANNWVPVSVRLWGGLLLDTKLPVLIIGSLLVGFFPLFLWHKTINWRLKRRIMSLEAISPTRPAETKRMATGPTPAAATPNIGTAGQPSTGAI